MILRARNHFGLKGYHIQRHKYCSHGKRGLKLLHKYKPRINCTIKVYSGTG